MKVVIGHKSLNLEELFNVSCLPSIAEVVIDSVTNAELAAQAPPQQKELQAFLELSSKLQLKPEHQRAILLVKLVQLIKMKKNATKSTVEYFTKLLNSGKTFEESEQLFKSVFEDARSQNIFFSDKELFILNNPVHLYQSIFALEVYRLFINLKFFDTTLSFSIESLQVHIDYVTEYALTLGKSTQGVTNFKNNIQALTDKSKLLSQQAPPKHQGELALPKTYQLHATLHERLLQLSQQLTNEINSEYGSLFQEKKYRELMQAAKDQQEEQMEVFALAVAPLQYLVSEMTKLSQKRTNFISGVATDQTKAEEESKSTSEDLHSVFNILASHVLLSSYQSELYSSFTKASLQEADLKAKAAAQEEGAKPDAKKKKKEAVTTVQFGSGTRKFFEYLLYLNLQTPDQLKEKLQVGLNKELDSVMSELLEQRNEERRRPKCAKGTRDMTPLQMAIREKAFNIIKCVFKRHGASEIDTPVFELKETLTGKYGEESKLIYDLEDQGGELLSLRYDLTVPFARYVALNNLPSIKRFHIAKVYRRDNPQMNKGRFREFYQCDFDIAGAYNLMIPDAEVLKVLVEILTELKIGGFIIKINHRKFLDAMVELAGCEKRKFKAICSAVDKLDKEPWEKVKEELITMKGLTEEMTNKLERFVTLVGKPKELLQRLKDEGIFKGHGEGEETIKEMDMVFSYLEAMGCLDNFQFDFSLARGLDYYTGLIYEAVLTDSNRVGSIAGGGRYDGLVGMFSGKQIPAVGVSIGIERIFSILEDVYKNDALMAIRATETQVLVAQLGKNLIEERMRVLGELWAAGFKAETVYIDNPKVPKQLDYAFDNGIPLVIWLGEEEVKQGLVKIKSLNKHEEYIVPRAELVQRIGEIIQDGNKVLLPQAMQKDTKKEEEKKE